MAAPRFLQALDNPVQVAPDEWVTDCPACELRSRGREHGLIHIHPENGCWRLDCDTCNHATAVHYLQLEPWQLRTDATRRHAIRAWNALTLAPTPEAWNELLNGRPIPRQQLKHA